MIFLNSEFVPEIFYYNEFEHFLLLGEATLKEHPELEELKADSETIFTARINPIFRNLDIRGSEIDILYRAVPHNFIVDTVREAVTHAPNFDALVSQDPKLWDGIAIIRPRNVKSKTNRWNELSYIIDSYGRKLRLNEPVTVIYLRIIK